MTNGAADELVLLCIGMVRSGSTWSYNLARQLLCASGREPADGGYEEAFADWVQSLPPGRPAVIKCHAMDKASVESLVSSGRRVRAIFTYRDAGAAIASSIRAFNLGFDQQAGAIHRAVQTYLKVAERWDTIAIPYDQVGSTEAAVDISTFLGLELAPSRIEDVALQNRREAASAMLETVDWQAPDGIYRDERYTFHRQSLLHRTHFADADQTRPRFALTEERLAVLNALRTDYENAGLAVGPEFYSAID